MYTEIKELVNFLAVFMHNRISRRRVSLCMESYGNHLVSRFHEKWHPDEPKYAENERLLPIKTLDGMDEMFNTIATSVGVNADDLFISFPTSIFVCCNPGEVTCRISEFPPKVIIWIGDVDADTNYVRTPLGAAKYYDGNIYNIQNTVLNAANLATMPPSRPPGFPRNKEIKPERCIPLDLVDSSEIAACDLLGTGFVDVCKVPPCLFRFTPPEFKSFTVRSFAATRFGSHRPRPDHEAMRRIQHAAAYLAVTGKHNAFGGNVTYGMFPRFSPLLNPIEHLHHPPGFPVPLSSYIGPLSSSASFRNEVHIPRRTYIKPIHSTPAFGTINPSPIFANPSRIPGGSIQFLPIFPQAASANAPNYVFPWNYTASSNELKVSANNIAFASYSDQNQHQFTWPYSRAANDTSSSYGSAYELWQPTATYSSSYSNENINNNNRTPSFTSSNASASVIVQNTSSATAYAQPLFGAYALPPPTQYGSDFGTVWRAEPIDSNSLQPLDSSVSSEVNDLQYGITQMSFVEPPSEEALSSDQNSDDVKSEPGSDPSA